MIVDLSSFSVPQEDIYDLLKQSSHCPPLSPCKYHSMVIQLPQHHRVFVKMKNGKTYGLISVFYEQKLSDQGMYVAHITELEVRESSDNSLDDTIFELIHHVTEAAKKNKCCRIISNVREEYNSSFEALSFLHVNGFLQKEIRPYYY